MKSILTYDNQAIHYQQFGNGKRIIIALHGAFQDSLFFNKLANYIEDSKVIALDLPFHGATQWHKETISKDDAIKIIELFRITFNTDKINIIAYSIGAKFSFPYIIHNYNHIESLLYIAPDGFNANKLYYFFTTNNFGRMFFKIICNHTDGFIKLLNTMKLMPKDTVSIIKKNKINLGNRLFAIWNGFKDLNENIEDVFAIIKQENIKTSVIYGAYDTIIKPKIFTPLASKNNFINWIMVRNGHNLQLSNIQTFIIQHYRNL